MTIYDGRNPQAPTRRRYDGLAGVIIEICSEAPKGRAQICAALAERMDCNEAALEPVLSELINQRVLYEERGKCVTLAIPENPYL